MAFTTMRVQQVVVSSASQRFTCNAAQPKPRVPLPQLSSEQPKFSLAAFGHKLCSIGAAALICLSPALDAKANEKVAEFATSGLIPVPGLFRDTVQVIELVDPGVEGVKLYYTDYSRSLVEKLSNDPFGDPSQSSVTCVAVGPVRLLDPVAAKKSEGQEIFNELKTLNLLQNKRLRVRRIYDERNGTIIYITYNTRNSSSAEEGGISSSRYRTSICALPVSQAPALQ